MRYSNEFPTEEVLREAISKMFYGKVDDNHPLHVGVYFPNKQAKDAFEKMFNEMVKQEYLKQNQINNG